MILIRVAYHTLPGKRDAFAARIVEDGIMEATRQEAGNLAYDFSIPLDKKDVVELLEMWESQEAVEVHCTQPMFLHLRHMKQDYVDHSNIAMFDAQQREQ